MSAAAFAAFAFLAASVDQSSDHAVVAEDAGEDVAEDTLILFLLVFALTALSFAAVTDVDSPAGAGHSRHGETWHSSPLHTVSGHSVAWHSHGHSGHLRLADIDIDLTHILNSLACFYD